MKKIVAPELRVVRFESNDIIVTSGPREGGYDTTTDPTDAGGQQDGWTAPSRNGGVWD